jgi:hypothetical protein
LAQASAISIPSSRETVSPILPLIVNWPFIKGNCPEINTRLLEMTDDINTKLEDLNIQLDEASTPAGSYVPYVISNNLVFISGQ